MLILTRRVGESVVIGNEIYCTLLGFQRNGLIQIAFEAPKAVTLNRLEVHNRIREKIKNKEYEWELNENENVIHRLATSVHTGLHSI